MKEQVRIVKLFFHRYLELKISVFLADENALQKCFFVLKGRNIYIWQFNVRAMQNF